MIQQQFRALRIIAYMLHITPIHNIIELLCFFFFLSLVTTKTTIIVNVCIIIKEIILRIQVVISCAMIVHNMIGQPSGQHSAGLFANIIGAVRCTSVVCPWSRLKSLRHLQFALIVLSRLIATSIKIKKKSLARSCPRDQRPEYYGFIFKVR